MAWTQADLDALEARILTARKAVAIGDRSVTEYDLKELISLRDSMKQVVASGSGAAVRCTYATFNKG